MDCIVQLTYYHGFNLGKVESNGTVRNRNNSILGKVESDGTVRDSNNHILGYARGIPQRYAAVFFFSFF